MASSLSNLADNLAERILKIKCKYRHDNKKCEKCGIKYKDCEYYLENKSVKVIQMLVVLVYSIIQ